MKRYLYLKYNPYKERNKTIYHEMPKRFRLKQKKKIGEFELERTLGEGTFGKVQMGTHIITKEKVRILIKIGCNKNIR